MTGFDLYLTNGITGLREMAAALNNVPKQKQYVADVEAGKRTGLRLFWTTESIDQFDGKYKCPVKISNPAEARAAVQYVMSLGSNYVKVYNGLTRANYLAILDEAKKLGMPVTGHVPDVISVREASRLGQKCMEHLDGFLMACSTKEAEARYLVRLNRYPWKMLLDTFDANKAAAVFAELSKNQTWVTPTLMIHHLEAFAKGSLEDSDPRIAYVRRDYLGEWRGVRNNVPDQLLQRRLLDKHVQLAGMLYRAGVPLLAGTDTPNPGSIPGIFPAAGFPTRPSRVWKLSLGAVSAPSKAPIGNRRAARIAARIAAPLRTANQILALRSSLTQPGFLRRQQRHSTLPSLRLHSLCIRATNRRLC